MRRLLALPLVAVAALLAAADLRHPARECPSCGRHVYLNRDGCYRRHFAIDPDGRRHHAPSWLREGAGKPAPSL
jgi:hypothetical protein